MKKTLKILTIVAFILFTFLSLKVDASTLNTTLHTLNITLNKETIHPEEEVTLIVNFGQTLGAYDFEFAYDNNLLDFVSVEGGTANDTGDKVIVSFYDTTGGNTPRNNMSIVFRAVSDITTSNPTNISITASGLANADASETYNDITIPIIKNLIVEPLYEDYKIALNYEGTIIENTEKEIDIVISSAMGKNYEHVRLLAEISAPENGIAKMIAIDNNRLNHDIIQSGWGPAEGYELGGKNIIQTINTVSLFSKAGEYQLTLKLVDRDTSDAVIASQIFTIDVANTPGTPENPSETTPPQPSPPGEVTPPDSSTPDEITPPEDQTPNDSLPQSPNAGENAESEAIPQTLPKTGVNMYLVCAIAIFAFSVMTYVVYKKK